MAHWVEPDVEKGPNLKVNITIKNSHATIEGTIKVSMGLDHRSTHISHRYPDSMSSQSLVFEPAAYVKPPSCG